VPNLLGPKGSRKQHVTKHSRRGTDSRAPAQTPTDVGSPETDEFQEGGKQPAELMG